MIEELPSRRLAYRFTHELVRRALYDRLSGVRRAEMHLRVGEALERSEGRSGRALADLAHHFAAAAPLDEAQRGIEYNVAAARAAAAAVAFDEAATRLRTALELGIEEPRQARGGVPRARHRQPPRRRRARRAGGVQGDGGHRPRAGRRRTARACRDRLRGGVLASGDRRPGRGRAARGGDDRAGRRQPRAARRAAQRARTRTRLPGRARARRHRPHQRRGPRPPAARSGAAGHGAGALVLVAGHELARRDPRDAHRGRDLGEELGDTEILAEAMAWRVPTFVALGDLESARREVAALLATAEQTAQPFMLHVAEHYGSTIALCDGRLEEAEASGAALARVEPAAERERRRRRLRDPDVQHPPRAGTARGARADHPHPGRRRRPRRAVAARPRLRARRARHGGGGEAGARARRRRGARPVPRVAVAGRAGLPDRRLRGARRRGHRRDRLPGARAARRDERDDRPPRGLPRGGRPLSRDARGDPGRMGARGGALRARDGAQPPDGGRDVAGPHRLRARAHAAGARARPSAIGSARCSARRPRWPSTSACRRCSVAFGPSAPRRRPSAIPTSCPRARSRSCASSRGA